MAGLFRVPGPLGQNWKADVHATIVQTRIVLLPSTADDGTPGSRPDFWPDDPTPLKPTPLKPKPFKPTSAKHLTSGTAGEFSEHKAKTAPAKTGATEPNSTESDDPPQEVLSFPPDTATRMYRHIGEFLYRYDLVDGEWIVTRKINLTTDKDVKVLWPFDTPSTKFRILDGYLLKYKYLDDDWVIVWKMELRTGNMTEITPPQAIRTKGRVTKTGVRVSDNGLPLAPRSRYNNIIAREWAAKGYINYAEILEAGHGCMACHITHDLGPIAFGHVPTDDELNINRYVELSKEYEGYVTGLEGTLLTGPIMAMAESGLVMSETVVHMTNASSRTAILGEAAESWGKIGGKYGVFGVDASRVPNTPLMRQVVATHWGDLTSEIRISGRMLEQFRRPAPIGPFSAFRRYSGVRSTPLGSVDLANNKFIRNEVFVNGVFRQATSREIMKYQIHQFVLDYVPDMGLYIAGGLYTSAGTHD